MNDKINIENIAKLAGVSRSTVSRVLTNSKNVKVETKERILQIMKEYDYTPSIMARGLATGKMNIIALVVTDIRNPFYSELVWVINQSLREKGYMMTLYNCGYDAYNATNLFHQLFEYGLSGIIVADASNDSSFGAILAKSPCPIVLVNRELDSIYSYDTVMLDNKKGGYLATKHLISLGHRRIAMLKGISTSTTSQSRYNGYLAAMNEAGLIPEEQYISYGDLTMESGEEYARNVLFKHESHPTAVFAGNDLMAYGIINVCKEYNVGIPDDISIIGFDDIQFSKTPLINLTTMKHPFEKIGHMVAEKIIHRIQFNSEDTEKVIINPTLIIRGTTDKPNQNY